jgi:hypothetical protein
VAATIGRVGQEGLFSGEERVLILLFILFIIFVSECLEYCYYYFFFHGTLICFDLVKREKRV